MKTTHVAIDSGNSDEAGVVIDQRFETRGVEVLFAHQIDQHTRIEIAAARSHDHPTGRGQTHAGVNGLTAFNGGETGAIAEMRNYQSIRQSAPKLAYDRLARKAVKSIAVDAIRSQLQGERQGARDIWHSSVKRRIEAGHLWQLREVLLREANDRQRRRMVQRREDGCPFELPQHRFVDQAMAAKIRPTVHHAMPDRGRLGLFAVCEKRPDACDRVLLGSKMRRFGNQRLVVRVFRPELALAVADRLGFAREKHLRDGRLDLVKSELER